MPFKSEKQRRYMWAKHPEIAKRWAHEEKSNMPKKKYSEQTINAAKLSRRTPAEQYAISQRVGKKKAYAEADRLAAQRRKAVAAAKKPPAPLTPAQRRSRRAAALRERVEPGVFARLRKALGGR